MKFYRSSSHVYWRCRYHIVWTPRYRFRILKDKLGKELYRTIYILCGIKDCTVSELTAPRPKVMSNVLTSKPKTVVCLLVYLSGYLQSLEIFTRAALKTALSSEVNTAKPFTT